MCISEMKIHFLSLLTSHVTQTETETVAELAADTLVVELDLVVMSEYTKEGNSEVVVERFVDSF
jgi:hypothetical protein